VDILSTFAAFSLKPELDETHPGIVAWVSRHGSRWRSLLKYEFGELSRLLARFLIIVLAFPFPGFVFVLGAVKVLCALNNTIVILGIVNQRK